MALYTASSPRVEVNGETVLSVVDGMGAFKNRALKILEDNGISGPKPGEWYAQQNWLNAFKEIAEKLGDKTLFSIGKSIPRNAQFPPDIDSIDKALGAIDVAYHMNHRNGDIGNYKFKLLKDSTGKFLCDNPYPCAFDQGIITAMAERFKPENSNGVNILHPPEAKCRHRGDPGCIYVVKW
jgi:hypothetical protein